MDRKAAMTGLGIGVGVGIGLLYFLDPETGKKRRDRTGHAFKKVGTAIGKGAKQVGMTVSAPFRTPRSHTSERLIERVRSTVRRVLSHPGAIEVTAMNGVVTLSGPVLKSEAAKLIPSVETIQGVAQIVDRLNLREPPEGEPALQREPAHPLHWSMTTRVLAGATGGALAIYGVRYASTKLSPDLLGTVLQMVPFKKHNYIHWWQRPFA
jgi:hypothetical protein